MKKDWLKKLKKEKVKEEVKRYNPKYTQGLSSYQVEKREQDGLINKTKIKISGTYLKIICKNVFTFFNILLITIGIILIIFNLWTSTVFLVILLLNLAIGLVQDIRAKMAVDKLSLVEKDRIIVIRDGKEKEIFSDDIVLDDIILCKKDAKIPCDAIVIKGEGSVNESLLTGESLPTKKILNSALYSGTYVTNGSFYARVDKVGEENYISKLQLKTKEYKKPLSRMFLQLNRLFRVLGILVIVIGMLDLIEFGLISILNIDPDITNVFEWLENNQHIILSLAGSLISMIPSGMYLLTSVTLTVGVIALTRQKVLVKDMYSQETLARVDTLCIDKTGTITDGSMSVFDYKLITKTMSHDRFEALIASYCHKLGEDNETSQALLNYFHSKKIFKAENYIPFSSVYKYSAAELEDNGTLVIGAYNFFPLKNSDKIKDYIEESSQAGFRTIVVGLSKSKIVNNKLPNDIEAIGVILLQDHIREEARASIKWFNENDVDIKVISGDNPLTVLKIAEASGVKNTDKYISLEGKTEEEVQEAALNYTIFGRVSPEQKEIIIKTLRTHGHTVAMVGDGINDVLSLKSADVSIALESGSKATRDIANLVLLNNDFTKLPDVVFQGRRVINNLQRTCSLFLTKTIFAILVNVFFLVYAIFTQFGTTQAILWPFAPNNFYCWEFCTIGLSAFLLALEPNKNIIKGDFLKNVITKALPHGILIGLAIIVFYLALFLGQSEFTNTEMLNVATLFITAASFLPLISVSRPLNKYRTAILVLAVLLVVAIYAWSIYGVNWVLINGPSSSAPRYLKTEEIIAAAILIASYVGLYLIYFGSKILWRKYHGKFKFRK